MRKTGPKPRPLAERFWSKVEKTEQCWIWRGSLGNGGYGVISISVILPNGRRASCPMRATHVALELTHGRSVPPGVFVLHSCDTPACIRPDHLRLGTAQDNADDMRVRNRMARGSQRGHAKLTEPMVSAMRAEYLADTTMSYERIAAKYGATRAAVAGALTGATWQHVPGAIEPHALKRTRRLTEDQVRSIYRRHLDARESMSAIATSLGVTRTTVFNILHGYVWKDVFSACGYADSLVVRRRRTRWSRVTSDDVKAIRAAYAHGGITMWKLASQYGVSESAIQHIIRRQSWNDVV